MFCNSVSLSISLSVCVYVALPSPTLCFLHSCIACAWLVHLTRTQISCTSYLFTLSSLPSSLLFLPPFFHFSLFVIFGGLVAYQQYNKPLSLRPSSLFISRSNQGWSAAFPCARFHFRTSTAPLFISHLLLLRLTTPHLTTTSHPIHTSRVKNKDEEHTSFSLSHSPSLFVLPCALLQCLNYRQRCQSISTTIRSCLYQKPTSANTPCR